jgi:acyl dehydratase
MARTVLEGVSAVRGAVGRRLGTSEWLEVTSARVEEFRRAVGGAPGADDDTVPPYLILSLSNALLPTILEVTDVSMGVNYGTRRVEFPVPMPVGGRVRATVDLVAADEVSGGVQTTARITMEADGVAEPVCTIESLSRYLV